MQRLYEEGNTSKARLTRALKDAGVKATGKEVEAFLKSQVIAQVKAPVKKRTRGAQTFTSQPKFAAAIDLWDLSKSSNPDLKAIFGKKGAVKYVLVSVDIFSRRIKTAYLRSKSEPEVLRALDNLFPHSTPYKQVFGDGEAAWNSNEAREFWLERSVHFIRVEHAPHAESGIKELKERYENNQILQKRPFDEAVTQAVQNYNQAIHPSTDTKPAALDAAKLHSDTHVRAQVVQLKVLAQRQKRVTTATDGLTVGATVRLAEDRGQFKKASKQKWSTQTYTVATLAPQTATVEGSRKRWQRSDLLLVKTP